MNYYEGFKQVSILPSCECIYINGANEVFKYNIKEILHKYFLYLKPDLFDGKILRFEIGPTNLDDINLRGELENRIYEHISMYLLDYTK